MKIFCDFDGTVAKNDVGNLLFRTFADERCFEIVKRWKAGEISSKQCLVEECGIARVSRQELQDFADGQELDAHFVGFVNFCQENNIEVEIVSDGLDFYIERILQNHGLAASVAVHANHLIFLNENEIKPEFPYFELGCGRCGNCKGYHVQQARANHDKLIYIGDGLSDRCGAETADITFAKQDRDLLRYCQEHKIPYHEFQDFADVLNDLHNIVDHL